ARAGKLAADGASDGVPRIARPHARRAEHGDRRADGGQLVEAVHELAHDAHDAPGIALGEQRFPLALGLAPGQELFVLRGLAGAGGAVQGRIGLRLGTAASGTSGGHAKTSSWGWERAPRLYTIDAAPRPRPRPGTLAILIYSSVHSG